MLLVVRAGATAPQLSAIMPTGVQRGEQATLVLTGARLADAQELLCYQRGITVTKLVAEASERVNVTIQVAKDCPLGEHAVRLRTATGISELRTFYVGALPIVAEKEDNTVFEHPQPIPLDVTVAGVVTNEDVDYFAVEAKAGQRLTAEIEAMRLGRTMFDPAVAILDAKRFELTASDDTALLLQDSVASLVVPADGTYWVRVAEASLGGGDGYHYRLHVGTFPRPTMTYPPGGPPGAALELRLLGDVAGEMTRTVSLPKQPSRSWPVTISDDSGITPSPLHLRVNDLPNQLESEPNDKRADAKPPHTPPCALNGIIQAAGDVDVWRIVAKKGQPLDIEAFARRLRSPLDPVVSVHAANGKQLAGDDDARKVDSYVRFDPPADGEYFIAVHDHLMRGGADFVYRIELAEPRPRLNTYLPRMTDQQPQYRQAISVPRGNRSAVLIRALRQNCGGDVLLEPAALPEGLSLDGGLIPAARDVTPLVLAATPEAPAAGMLVDLRGRIKRDGGDLVGEFVQDVPLVRGPPNNTVYYKTWVDRLAVAVTEAVPFHIELAEPAVPLVRSGRIGLRVRVQRDEGFAEPIEVRMLWNPPGISSPIKISIPKQASEADYALNAAGDAAVGIWPIVVIARAKVGDGEAWVSSQLVHLNVSKPYVTGQLQMAATQRGQPAAMLCKLDQHKPFEGTATIRLLNLPPRTKAEPVEITKDDEQVAFNVLTELDAPVGQHKNLFCELVIREHDTPIVHRIAGGGVLRIDNPPPAPVAKAKPTAPKPAARPAKPKPLSRLEQLRKQAAERAARAAEGTP